MNTTLYKEYDGTIANGFKLNDNAPIELGYDYKDKAYLGWHNLPGWRSEDGRVYPGHINKEHESEPGFLQRNLDGKLTTVQGIYDKITKKIKSSRRSLKPVRLKLEERNDIALSENKRYRIWRDHLHHLIRKHECDFEVDEDENIYQQWKKFLQEYDYQNKVYQLSKSFHRGIPYGRGPGICKAPNKGFKDPRNASHWKDYTYEMQFDLLTNYIEKVKGKLNLATEKITEEMYEVFLDILQDDEYIEIEKFTRDIMHKALAHYIWFDFFTYGPGGYLSQLILSDKFEEDDLTDRMCEKHSENAIVEYINHEMGDIVDSYYFHLDCYIIPFLKKGKTKNTNP